MMKGLIEIPIILIAGIVLISVLYISSLSLPKAAVACSEQLIGSEQHSYPYVCPSTYSGKTVKYCQYVDGGIRTVLPGSGSTITGNFRVDYFAEVCEGSCPINTVQCGTLCIDTNYKCDPNGYVYWSFCTSTYVQGTRAYNCLNPADSINSYSENKPGAAYCGTCSFDKCWDKDRYWNKNEFYTYCSGDDGYKATCLGNNQWSKILESPGICKPVCTPPLPECKGDNLYVYNCVNNEVKSDITECEPGTCKIFPSGGSSCTIKGTGTGECFTEGSKCGSMYSLQCCGGLTCKGAGILPGICVKPEGNTEGSQCSSDSDCASGYCSKGSFLGITAPYGSCGPAWQGWLRAIMQYKEWIGFIVVFALAFVAKKNVMKALTAAGIAWLLLFALGNIWLLIAVGIVLALVFAFIPQLRRLLPI